MSATKKLALGLAAVILLGGCSRADYIDSACKSFVSGTPTSPRYELRMKCHNALQAIEAERLEVLK